MSAPPREVASLETVDSATVANAIEILRVRDRTEGFLDGSIECRFPDLGPMVGYAVTATMVSRPGPVASREGYWRLWDAVSAAPSPSVLVVKDLTEVRARCAFVGEVMAAMALRLECVGMVTDGGVRDLAEVEALGFKLFSEHVVVSHGNFEVVDVNVEVRVGQEVVRPGDLIHADLNGVVIIPPDSIEQVSAAITSIQESERDLLTFIGSSQFSLDEARRRSGY